MVKFLNYTPSKLNQLGQYFFYSFIQQRCIKLTESDSKGIFIYFLKCYPLNVLNKESLKNIMFLQKY